MYYNRCCVFVVVVVVVELVALLESTTAGFDGIDIIILLAVALAVEFSSISSNGLASDSVNVIDGSG